MISILENLYYRKYRISFIVTQPFAFDGYPFHLLRGIFGMVVRNEVCIKTKHDKCSLCSINQNCPYTEIFEVQLPSSHQLYGKYTNPPVPYILYPDLGGRSKFARGDSFPIELTLIGNAIEYDTFLLNAIQRIGEGEGKLFQKLQCAGIETMVGDNKKSHLRFESETLSANHLKLCFNSPVILKIKEKPASNLPFSLLIERLTERLAVLSYLYCGGNLPDFKSFRKAEDTEAYIDSFYPVNIEIHDGGNKQTPPKDGMLGSVAYAGNLGEWMPIIRAGEVLHLGGYTNYGLGKYTIDEAYYK